MWNGRRRVFCDGRLGGLIDVCFLTALAAAASTATAGTLLTHRELEFEIEQTVGKHITIPLSDYIVGILDLGSDIQMRANRARASRIAFGLC